MLMWLMSDRALPKSYRMMEGFGVHTYRFVNREGKGTFVKFHWRPKLGTHSLVWDETQKIAGADPDFNRRDLWEAIEAGNGPEYDLAVQLVPEDREHDFDFDLLDPTKIIPEEEVPLEVIGHMVLNRNPDNFFAETEQVAFCVQNVVPGIDFTNDPLLQARLFSYLDTQLIRLGGPNFVQLPVNRPVAEVHHHQRDGYGQHRLDVSPVSYHKNSIAGGCPHLAAFEEGGYRHYQERVDGAKIRQRSPSFQDHYSQATLFWNSMSEWEQQHIAEALQFELGKVEREFIRERMLERLAHVDHGLATQVAEGLGLPAPDGAESQNHGRSSPALSQAHQPHSAQTRKVAVLAADGVDSGPLDQVLEKLRSGGAICEVLAPHGGNLGGGTEVDRPLQTMASVLYDAVLVAGGRESVEALRGNGAAVRYVAEAYKHAKPLAAIGEGVDLLREAPFDDVKLSDDGLVDDSGVVTLANGNGDVDEFSEAFIQAIAAHRHFDRAVEVVPA
jgi:catalase